MPYIVLRAKDHKFFGVKKTLLDAKNFAERQAHLTGDTFTVQTLDSQHKYATKQQAKGFRFL